jgi:hypothetical protein
MKNPKKILQQILASLKPNGLLIFEEPIISSGFCYPANCHYKQSRALLYKLSKLRGCDFDIRMKLEYILFSCVLKIIS